MAVVAMHVDTTDPVAQFQEQGYFITPAEIPADLIRRARARMDAVLEGDYPTGIRPYVRWWNPGDPDTMIKKVDQAHACDPVLLELLSHPSIGQWAARLTGAKTVQIWCTQLIVKPPLGKDTGNVGWHQDMAYWQSWQGEVFTCWLALSDVNEDSGPVTYVPGSHKWGLIKSGDFYDTDRDAQKRKFPVPPGEQWNEVAAVMPAGSMVFHHNLTVHGSGPNLSNIARRSFAIHLRTEKANPTPGDKDWYVSGQNLDSPVMAPVIYRTISLPE